MVKFLYYYSFVILNLDGVENNSLNTGLIYVYIDGAEKIQK